MKWYAFGLSLAAAFLECFLSILKAMAYTPEIVLLSRPLRCLIGDGDRLDLDQRLGE